VARKQDLRDRLQRAESWIRAAETLELDQDHERFMFCYIALNAMYGRRQYEGNRSDVWQDLDRFVSQVKTMYEHAVDETTAPLLTALRHEHVDALVLDYFLLDGLFRGDAQEKLVGRCKRELTQSKLKLISGDPFTMLRVILQRLTVLRNRVMHGCVSYGSISKGLPSVSKGARVASALVPAVHRLMTTHGESVKWDPIPYPRVVFDDPRERLSL